MQDDKEGGYNEVNQVAPSHPTEFAHVEFNKNRKIIIQNVPPVTYEEVKEYIGGFGVSNISISKKCRHAVVTLLHGEEAEEAVHLLSNTPLHDTDVDVSIYPQENLLCLTQLPFTLQEDEFQTEMEKYGTLEKCFLMRNEKTGDCKGYGFVQFVHNKEKSKEACDSLNGKRLESSIIQCSFVNPSVLRFQDLHSTSLLIDCLPPDYKNLQELKNICSTETEPTWCQLGRKNGQHLGFAVVQYRDACEAEAAQKSLNEHDLGSCIIKTTFCRPGEKAEELYKEMVDIRLKRIEAINLPIPSVPPENPAGLAVNPNLASPVVKTLLMDNPDALTKFVELLNIMQLQTLQQQQQHLESALMGPLMNPNLQIALLAVLMAQQIQNSQPGFVADPTTQHFILNSLHNEKISLNMQDSKQPSLLGSPLVAQANSMLQNVFNDKDTNKSQDSTNANNVNPSSTQPVFNLFPGPEGQSITTDTLIDFNQLVCALTPGRETVGLPRTARNENTTQTSTKQTTDAKATSAENTSGIPQSNNMANVPKNSELKQELTGTSQAVTDPSPFFNLPGVGFADPFLASFIESQIKHQVQQLKQTAPKPASLMDLPLPGTKPFAWPPVMPQTAGIIPQGKPGLLGEVPNRGKAPSLLDNIQSTPTSYKPPSLLGNLTEKRTLSFDDNRSELQSNQASQSLLGEPPATLPRLDNAVSHVTRSWEGFCKNLTQSSSSSSSKDSCRTEDGEPLSKQRKVKSLLDVDLGGSDVQKTTYKDTENRDQYAGYVADTGQTVGNVPPPPPPPPSSESWQNYNGPYSDPYYSQSYQNYMMHCHQVFSQYMQRNYQDSSNQQYPDPMNYNSSGHYDYSQYTGSDSSYSQDYKPMVPYQQQQTPYPSDQKAHLLPSPEPSPDGAYVGQHSQGLGGHYAENYKKRQYNM